MPFDFAQAEQINRKLMTDVCLRKSEENLVDSCHFILALFGYDHMM